MSVGGVSLLDMKYKMILGDNPDFGNPKLTLLCYHLRICKLNLFLDCSYLLLLLPRIFIGFSGIFIGIRRKLFWRILKNACGVPVLGSIWGWAPPSLCMFLLPLFSLPGTFEDSSCLSKGRFYHFS